MHEPNETAFQELTRDAFGRLVLVDLQRRRHVGVVPVDAFPISAPRASIALCDAEGRELVWIDRLEAVPAPFRQLVEDELAQRQFLPVIRRIVSVQSATEPSEWHVETDRGLTHFLLVSDEHVTSLGEHRALITDVNQVRYLVADVRQLDGFSRRILERYF